MLSLQSELYTIFSRHKQVGTRENFQFDRGIEVIVAQAVHEKISTMVKAITNLNSSSGKGFTYEHRVAAVYASALLCEQSAHGLEGKIVSRVALQRKAVDEPMDDVIVDAVARNADIYRLSLQVKQSLTITSAPSNTDFREVIEAAYLTITSQGFDRGLHRVGVVTGKFTSAEALPAFSALCSAAAHQSASSFTRYYGTNGGIPIVTNKVVRDQYDSVTQIIAPLVASGDIAEQTHRLLSSFVPIEMRLGSPGASDELYAEQMIRNFLPEHEKALAGSVWRCVLDIVDLGTSLSAELDREKIIAGLDGQFEIPSARQTNASPSPSKWWKPRRRLVALGVFASLFVAVGTWGLSKSERESTNAQPLIPVPGRSMIDRSINLAKMEGATSTDASNEFVIAIPFARPSLPRGSTMPEGANVVALSNASPLRVDNQDIVFGAGRCRMLGTVEWPDQSILQGEATIQGLSCVMENGDSYSLGRENTSPIGFVTEAGTPANRTLSLIDDDKTVTLPPNHRYMVRFFEPVRALTFTGKSAITW
ncbi:hypothetical protein [Burkholderia metallica]|uniref:Uncharacterized protein n=1 Tax=Burkholderia metallica TaxID=488729 RepID=A0ABT8P5P6_9BURK|nr:hypothetical protein [Burkholderia metallica]MCA7999904.1 hypothetical protein [Burkholderia metallica]MCA8017399.1 hypothetical protein [Burkholderia metallica]MDN7930276.1 hypothetical protein [Burkholderia metallica]VWB79110.1 hypothetical protein BME24068_03746 [Burkholderia metallica]